MTQLSTPVLSNFQLNHLYSDLYTRVRNRLGNSEPTESGGQLRINKPQLSGLEAVVQKTIAEYIAIDPGQTGEFKLIGESVIMVLPEYQRAYEAFAEANIRDYNNRFSSFAKTSVALGVPAGIITGISMASVFSWPDGLAAGTLASVIVGLLIGPYAARHSQGMENIGSLNNEYQVARTRFRDSVYGSSI